MKKTSLRAVGRSSGQLAPDLKIKIHDLMVKARCLEVKLIKMSKGGEGFFWIGGPGEEAFAVPLGLLVKKGQGLDHDFLHLHYRASGTLTAMGMPMIDAIRQMKNVATDPFTGGRNFVNHYAKKDWNVMPVTSTIETQYSISIGSAWAQRRHGGTGISIVTGGDAGTAEGDFASCLIWSSRKGFELPNLIIVTNNHYGISTPAEGQHGENEIADRARAFNIEAKVFNGNSVTESYMAIQGAMDYVRSQRKPFFLEAQVSRLYGHSSSSGANFVNDEDDCIRTFERELLDENLASEKELKEAWEKYTEEANFALETARKEPPPTPESIYDHIYYEGDDV
jgi:2-oxoisovalerate dehydrogenase E1 component alpha subunit